MRKIIGLFLIFLPIVISAQSTGWSKEFDTQKSFIENKGQFKSITFDSKTSEIVYAFDSQNEEYFFTKSGVIIELSEKKKRVKSEGEKNARQERKAKGFTEQEWIEFEREGQRLDVKIDGVNCEWLGSNPNVQIISEGKNSFSHSYSYYDKNGELKHVNNASSFNKLIYKNLYPNIDVVYELHKDGGLKYSVVVYPGGNISDIKLQYSKDANLNSDGTIKTPTLFGDIIDHKPFTFYEDNQVETINSSYTLLNNMLLTLGLKLLQLVFQVGCGK